MRTQVGEEENDMATLMQDHPGWTPTQGGAIRVMRCGGVAWRLAWTADRPGAVSIAPVNGEGASRPVVEHAALSCQRSSEIATVVYSIGPVLRVRNGDLWDAIGTAIIRQVIRAGQARLMYRKFCQAHGQALDTAAVVQHLFPSAEDVLSLPAAAFAELGMAFKHRALTAAASAFLAHRDTWEHLTPPTLVSALQAVPHIGPWTAGAAVADWSGDFSVYPYSDLAVRTWAHRAAPATAWPDDEPTFGSYWRQTAGDDLSALTQHVLAWGGTHVRSP